MLKKIIKAILPPIVQYAGRNVYHQFKRNSLFDGSDKLFKATLTKETVYGEYGCGASTIWVLNNIGCEIFSVDSSHKWIDKVKNEMPSLSNGHIHWVDVGPIGDWGTPLGYSKFENFKDYTDWIWQHERKPNLVLIDGRFRVCCFLTSLLKADKGTKIFFDDYTDRPQYHVVERYLKPTEKCGRQAMFITPDCADLDVPSIKDSISQFRFVFD
jgi:hypothetical protein